MGRLVGHNLNDQRWEWFRKVFATVPAPACRPHIRTAAAALRTTGRAGFRAQRRPAAIGAAKSMHVIKKCVGGFVSGYFFFRSSNVCSTSAKSIGLSADGVLEVGVPQIGLNAAGIAAFVRELKASRVA
jgi:hypothetical protein